MPRRLHNFAPNQRVLLVMGTTEPRKSQIVLAEAFARVAEDHPEALLVFVGDNGTPYARSLRQFVEASGAAKQIRLEPVTADSYSWYRSADVLVSASDIESLPRSFLEAMCFGLPVAAASVFGIPDLIQDGRTGFLFRPRDLGAMVDAVRRVLSTDSDDLAGDRECGTRQRPRTVRLGRLCAEHHVLAQKAVRRTTRARGLSVAQRRSSTSR